MNTMWAVSLSGLLGKMTKTHPRLNLLTNTKNLILKKLEYVMKVGFFKMISSISMCSSLIKEVSHFLQGSSTLTKYCWINNICSWFIVNLYRAIENNNFHFRFSFLQTPDNDTVLAALLEVMVETSMLLFRCCKPWIIFSSKGNNRGMRIRHMFSLPCLPSFAQHGLLLYPSKEERRWTRLAGNIFAADYVCTTSQKS